MASVLSSSFSELPLFHDSSLDLPTVLETADMILQPIDTPYNLLQEDNVLLDPLPEMVSVETEAPSGTSSPDSVYSYDSYNSLTPETDPDELTLPMETFDLDSSGVALSCHTKLARSKKRQSPETPGQCGLKKRHLKSESGESLLLTKEQLLTVTTKEVEEYISHLTHTTDVSKETLRALRKQRR